MGQGEAHDLEKDFSSPNFVYNNEYFCLKLWDIIKDIFKENRRLYLVLNNQTKL